MALDGAGYAPSEFKLALKAESTIGTANVSSMNLINVDSVSLPALNPTQVLDVRSGDGRTAKAEDAFVTEKGTTKEIAFSGTADSTVLPLLLQNITTTAVGSSPASYDVAYNYSPPELETGDNSSITIRDTVTVAVVSPEAGNDQSIVFPGCCLTSLSLTGDMGTESGRIKISGTFKTGFPPSYAQNKPTSMTAHGSTYYSLTDFHTTRTVAGISNCVIASWTLNLENDAVYLGYDGATAIPQSIVRAIPELAVSQDFSLKYDDNTAGMHVLYKNGSNAAIELSNHGTWSSASTFGVKAANGRITSVEWSDAAAMFVDMSIKNMATTSGHVIQIIA
tara:strand:+ start:4333 stop:5340 length:1008 start_codon:yes stop_codon:yes gene_type:complete